MEKYIGFTKVAEPYGWLGNMSPHPVSWAGRTWRTSEALFQALRFENDEIRRLIHEQKSPMGAKFTAKAHRNQRTVEPLSEEDVKNMEMCIKLKLDNHPELRDMLKETGDAIIFEDVSARARGNDLFWGAILKEGKLEGENVVGKIWMKFRASL